MDPLSLIIGAALLLIGLIIGSLIGATLLRRSKATSTPRAICSCKDAFSFHDPETGRCHALNAWGETCQCRHYDEPQPIEQYLATPTLPPRDGG